MWERVCFCTYMLHSPNVMCWRQKWFRSNWSICWLEFLQTAKSWWMILQNIKKCLALTFFQSGKSVFHLGFPYYSGVPLMLDASVALILKRFVWVCVSLRSPFHHTISSALIGQLGAVVLWAKQQHHSSAAIQPNTLHHKQKKTLLGLFTAWM